MIRKANNIYPVWDWPGSMNWIRSSGKSGSWLRSWSISSGWRYTRNKSWAPSSWGL